MVLNPLFLVNKFDLISSFERDWDVGSLISTKRAWPIKFLDQFMVIMKLDELCSLHW